MTTRRENILSYVMTAMSNDVTGVEGIYRSRVEALRREETPAVLLEFMQDNADYSTLDQMDWTLQFRVSVITRGDGPDTLADPIVSLIHDTLMADRTLGGLAFDILPVSTQFRPADGDQPIGVTECIFSVRYRTLASTMEV